MTSRHLRSLLIGCMLVLSGCVSVTDELASVREARRLDRAVLVTGGAFYAVDSGAGGTFRVAPVDRDDAPAKGTAGDADGTDGVTAEAIPFAAIVDVLERGRVFQRVVADPDDARRRRMRELLRAPAGDPALVAFLQQVQADGFDLLLVVEELQDGPIENRGTNGRWPVTFATWILLGVGMLIPDRTFESRATLRVSLRDPQTGAVVHDPLLLPGPIELALTERTDFWGILMSIVVPPFWVGDDEAAVVEAVRDTTQKRLLLSLARDLKGEVVRRRVGERAAADIQLVAAAPRPLVVVDSLESLSVVRLTGPGLSGDDARRFAAELLASRARDAGRFRYEAPLPATVGGGLMQVLVGTLRGGIASATFGQDSAR